ncbi:SDR family oxidoreductase [Streptomyces olivochromogenes]|uniref:SDR family oxidoreductase n=1 Tax=Streptomyces olivochromogenes TaxID=1963 RepID=UPI0035AE1A53|nr:SDR family oxidoreductase [Streptomyces olivochromogenes]
MRPGDPVRASPGTAPTAAAFDALTKTSQAGRPAQLEEIAGAAHYLASEVAGCVQGTTVVVDGGGLAARL